MNLDDFEGHTPGPWDYNDSFDNNTVRITDDTGKILYIICEVGDWANRDYDKEWFHNMELIAAAPDLLAEVKRLHEVLVTLKGTIDGYIRDEWDGNLEGWQCASDNIAALGIKSEWEEEE